MSVGRNHLTRAPFYRFGSVPIHGSGLRGYIRDLAASPTWIIAVGANTATRTATAGGSRMWTSTDGRVWTSVSTTSFGNSSVDYIAYGNNTFVALGGANLIATSPGTSGTTWTQRTSPASGSSTWRYITFQNGLFIIQNGAAQTLYYSSDGITWSTGPNPNVTLGKFYQDNSRASGIFYIDNNDSTSRWLVAVGNDYNTTAGFTHFIVLDAMSSTGNATNITATGYASFAPYWEPSVRKLIVATSPNSATANAGFHNLVSVNFDTASLNQSPDVGQFGQRFFPVIAPREIIQQYTTTGTIMSNHLTTMRINATPTAALRKAVYFFNDGWWNCVFINQGDQVNNGYDAYYVNVAFHDDTTEYASDIQRFGGGKGTAESQVTSAGLNNLTYVAQVQFKDLAIVMPNYTSGNAIGHAYLLGKRSIRGVTTFLP
jgi:hypothetical protein